MALGPPFIISIERSSGSISRRGDAGNPGLVRSPQVAANFFQPGFRDGGIVFEIGFKSGDGPPDLPIRLKQGGLVCS